MKCRHCATALTHTFLDLGHAPPSNAYLRADQLQLPETHYPLRIMVCDQCWLVQTEDYAQADALFNADYAYFSSTSTGWLAHAQRYAAKMVHELQLTPHSMVIEVASNDGYLLKNFLAAGIPCLGIEPTASTAQAALKLGIPVLQEFFGERLGLQLAAQGQQADLIAGNNVYAHVPDINDFTRGLKAALKPEGVLTLEFPHLLSLLTHNQFDTVYHEHFSYLSLHAVQRVFAAAGLRIWHVEALPTHGGSLRVFGCHAEAARTDSATVATFLTDEIAAGLDRLTTYAGFQERANRVKNEFLQFLLTTRQQGKTIAAYGAAAKGNTLLNYAGVKPDLLPYVCDAASAKQGMYLPGSHIAVLAPDALLKQPPDYVVILPWNIADEVISQLHALRAHGTRFVTAIPSLQIR